MLIELESAEAVSVLSWRLPACLLGGSSLGRQIISLEGRESITQSMRCVCIDDGSAAAEGSQLVC